MKTYQEYIDRLDEIDEQVDKICEAALRHERPLAEAIVAIAKARAHAAIQRERHRLVKDGSLYPGKRTLSASKKEAA